MLNCETALQYHTQYAACLNVHAATCKAFIHFVLVNFIFQQSACIFVLSEMKTVTNMNQRNDIDWLSLACCVTDRVSKPGFLL